MTHSTFWNQRHIWRIETAHLWIKATGLVKSFRGAMISIKWVWLARAGRGWDCDGSHAQLLARERQSQVRHPQPAILSLFNQRTFFGLFFFNLWPLTTKTCYRLDLKDFFSEGTLSFWGNCEALPATSPVLWLHRAPRLPEEYWVAPVALQRADAPKGGWRTCITLHLKGFSIADDFNE